MEIWDAYDEDLNKIDHMALIRGQDIPEHIFHLVCDIIVKHTDGTYLLMQRDKRKHFGGLWEATAGGSALQGETAADCAIRELREETGIDSKDLVEVGKVVNDDNRSIYIEFLCITNCDKDSVILQEGETVAYRWVSKKELAAMKTNELITERMQKFIRDLQE